MPKQHGAATAEFALTAVPLLLLGLTVTEAGHWFMTRQVVRLALHEAARAGATQHAHPATIRAAFEQALTPLYVPAGAYGTPQIRMQASGERLRRSTGLPPWHLDVLGPPTAAYQDFGRASGEHGARLVISNDYLAEQHSRAQARWPQGVGPRSGLTIHQANLLHLRLSYLKRPFTPIMGAVLKALAFAAPEHAQPALQVGLLSMTLESTMTMQSDPVAWEPADSTLTRHAGASRLPAPLPEGGPPPAPRAPLPTKRNELLPPGGASKPPPAPLLPTAPEDDTALCGIVLCCAPAG